MALFDVKSDKIQAALFALGFRQECGRCGGTGRYSYNQMDGDRCYGCNGKKFVAVKLTRKVLDEAKVKVEAGELVRIREVGARKIAARKSIAGLGETADLIHKTIGDAYTIASRANKDASVFVKSPIFFAQTMNNAISGRIFNIKMEVEYHGRKDFERCVVEIQEATDMLVQLRDAWLAFDAQQA
jgi:DnaJ-class molecular chaperone